MCLEKCTVEQPSSRISSAVPSLAEVLAREDMQEALFACCASDDVVDARTESEEKSEHALKQAISNKPHDQDVLCPEARSMVVWYMRHVVDSMRLPEKSWFDLVMLLDLYCLRAPILVQVGDLPCLCGALVRLLKKFETVIPLPNEDDLLTSIMHLAQHMRQAGHTVPHPAVTLESLQAKEQLVLNTLDWNIKLSSVDSWMSAFYARMNTITGQVLLPTLRLTWNHSLDLARTMLLQSGSQLSLSRRHAARGLLGIGFVAARLLAPDALDLDMDSLEESFQKMPGGTPQWQNGTGSDETLVPVVAQAVPAACHVFFLELLQVTTGSSLAALREDCKLVQNELRSRVRKLEKVHHESI